MKFNFSLRFIGNMKSPKEYCDDSFEHRLVRNPDNNIYYGYKLSDYYSDDYSYIN